MDKIRLFKRAYRLLDSSTPIRMDCGSLCEKACCKGDDNLGMYLFPGEEILLGDTSSFLTIKATDLYYSPEGCLRLAICNGDCDRSFRPLSCRIFPLVPYIDCNNALTIITDPRAARVCPLAFAADSIKLDRFFVRNVKKAMQLLIQDKEIEEYIIWLSGYINEYKAIQTMFE